MSTAGRRVIVVGGGVIGTACAYYLSKTGWSVSLVDRGKQGEGSSRNNCGFVCPSHVLPLTEPGAVGRTLKALFRRNSAFSIKPRLDPALWSWLWHFTRRCNHQDMLAAGKAIQALLESSLPLFTQVIEQEALDCEWETRGLLFVFKDRAEMQAYATTDQLLKDEFHCPAHRYDGEAVVALEPALQSGLAGGWHYEEDGHLRPDRLLSSWRRVLEARGVAVIEDCETMGFIRGTNGADGLRTSRGEMTADAFVIATGALTPKLQHELGCKIPIQPGKGYSLTMPRPTVCPTIPMIFPETRVAVTPFHTGYRLGSTMEFAGYDTTIHRARLQLLKDGASPYLREPFRDPVQEEWYGWRPMTYDGLPIIDRTPIMDNVLIAAGHNMLGLSMATGTGRLVAELLNDEKPHINPAPYTVRRF
jgi:D-amino-acid dehydrogenase